MLQMRCKTCGGGLPITGRNDRTGECVCAAPKTPAQRKADERQRYRDAGLKRVDLWAHPEDHAAIKAHAEKLSRKRARKDSERRQRR